MVKRDWILEFSSNKQKKYLASVRVAANTEKPLDAYLCKGEWVNDYEPEYKAPHWVKMIDF